MPDTGYDPRSAEPALSRRGYLLAAVIPVLIAAIAFAVVLTVDHTKETGAETTIRVPTSDWIPGQDGGETLIQGTLALDTRRCVYLDSTEQGRIWPVWPAGYTARISDEGKVSLYDGKNDLVGREGQRLQMAGDYTAPGGYAGEPCLPTDGQVAAVQSEVTALAG